MIGTKVEISQGVGLFKHLASRLQVPLSGHNFGGSHNVARTVDGAGSFSLKHSQGGFGISLSLQVFAFLKVDLSLQFEEATSP